MQDGNEAMPIGHLSSAVDAYNAPRVAQQMQPLPTPEHTGQGQTELLVAGKAYRATYTTDWANGARTTYQVQGIGAFDVHGCPHCLMCGHDAWGRARPCRHVYVGYGRGPHNTPQDEREDLPVVNRVTVAGSRSIDPDRPTLSYLTADQPRRPHRNEPVPPKTAAKLGALVHALARHWDGLAESTQMRAAAVHALAGRRYHEAVAEQERIRERIAWERTLLERAEAAASYQADLAAWEDVISRCMLWLRWPYPRLASSIPGSQGKAAPRHPARWSFSGLRLPNLISEPNRAKEIMSEETQTPKATIAYAWVMANSRGTLITNLDEDIYFMLKWVEDAGRLWGLEEPLQPQIILSNDTWTSIDTPDAPDWPGLKGGRVTFACVHPKLRSKRQNLTIYSEYLPVALHAIAAGLASRSLDTEFWDKKLPVSLMKHLQLRNSPVTVMLCSPDGHLLAQASSDENPDGIKPSLHEAIRARREAIQALELAENRIATLIQRSHDLRMDDDTVAEVTEFSSDRIRHIRSTSRPPWLLACDAALALDRAGLARTFWSPWSNDILTNYFPELEVTRKTPDQVHLTASGRHDQQADVKEILEQGAHVLRQEGLILTYQPPNANNSVGEYEITAGTSNPSPDSETTRPISE